MPKYKYKARDLSGNSVTGESEDLGSAVELRAHLKADGLTLVEQSEVGESRWGFAKLMAGILSRKIPEEEIFALYRQMELIYSTGFPVVDGLKLIEAQTSNPHLRGVIKSISEDINQGHAIHEAASRHPHIFTPTAVSLIEAGEVSGSLDVMLARVASLAEKEIEHASKVKSAMFYPKIVLVAILIVGIVAVYFVIPQFSAFFAQFGAELPLITRFVMGLSDFFTSYWFLILPLAASLVYFVKKYLRSPTGRLKWDQAKVKLPVLGRLNVNLQMENFCSVLAVLVGSGLPITTCLENLGKTVSNSVLRNDIQQALEQIKGGASIWSSLSKSAIFPGIVVGLLSVGEQSGSLVKVLDRLGSYYELQVDYQLKNLAKVIEPIFLFFIFIIIAILVIAIFLPMWQLASVTRGG